MKERYRQHNIIKKVETVSISYVHTILLEEYLSLFPDKALSLKIREELEERESNPKCEYYEATYVVSP